MTYPDGIDALVNVNATDTLAAGGHAARHNSVNTALEEVKDFLGTGTGYRYNSTVYFTSNGTFTKADYPWLRAIRVRMVGSGGGGGGAATTGAGQAAVANSGSGAAYAESFITDIVSLSASVTVTVAAGGAGGAAGANNGSNGSSSSFGTAVIAVGGAGGLGAGAVAPNEFFGTTTGGDAAACTGDLRLPGGAGFAKQNLSATVAVGPVPGSSILGIARSGNSTGTGANGGAGSLYGSGGLAGINTQNQATARAGGAGAAGIVIVELYA